MGKNAIVDHWSYMDGWQDIPECLRHMYNGETREFNKNVVGWHCWVYPLTDIDFPKWMKTNMKGKYDCTWRFNSGEPMYTVIISNDEDATLFKLTWY